MIIKGQTRQLVILAQKMNNTVSVIFIIKSSNSITDKTTPERLWELAPARSTFIFEPQPV